MAERLERVWGWGGTTSSLSAVHRPDARERVEEVFALARAQGRTIGLRGGGQSYGDAALNAGGMLLDLSRLNRILEWNPARGVARVEPGVTIGQLWQAAIADGWWPSVVPGTMAATISPGLDPTPARSLRVAAQQPPARLFGLLPRAAAWRLMQPLTTDTGVRLVNAATAALVTGAPFGSRTPSSPSCSTRFRTGSGPTASAGCWSIRASSHGRVRPKSFAPSWPWRSGAASFPTPARSSATAPISFSSATAWTATRWACTSRSRRNGARGCGR